MWKRSSRSSRTSSPERRRRRVVALLATLATAFGAGCSDGDAAAPSDEGPTPAPRALVGLSVASRDGALVAVIPSAFVVHRHTSAILATTSDGRGRLYVAYVPDAELTPWLGAYKDDVLGLGSVLADEKHFERATRLVFEEGPRQARRHRRSFVITPPAGGIILCEALHDAALADEWAPLHEALCLRATAKEAASGQDARPEGG